MRNEKKFPKTRAEVQCALEYHVMNMASLTDAQIKVIASQLGWAEERVKGYNEGVKWAYEWFLK